MSEEDWKEAIELYGDKPWDYEWLSFNKMNKHPIIIIKIKKKRIQERARLIISLQNNKIFKELPESIFKEIVLMI